MGMAKNDRDRASVRSDNRRMTGNVNIYICSEAFEKGKKNVETDNESAVINVAEKPKVTINPPNFGSDKVINRKIEQLTSNSTAFANNQEKLIMTTEFNEKSREEVKSRSSTDEKHKISGIVSCRCPRYDESDLWLENAKNKRERRTVVVAENAEDKKNVEELKDLKKDDENLLPIEQERKFSPSKHKSKVKLKKEKKNFKEAKKSKENNTWFSYFRRKADSNAKDDVIFGDRDLCTCEKDFFKKEIEKEKFKKHSKDKSHKKSTKTRKTNAEGEAESKKKIRNGTNEKKVSSKIKKTSDAQKDNIELKSPKKHDRKKRPLSEKKSFNEKWLSKQNKENQNIPKSMSVGSRNNLFPKKSSLKRNDPETNVITKKNVSTDKSFEKNILSIDSDKKNDKTEGSAQRVKMQNNSHEKKDLVTAQTSTLNNGSKDLVNKGNEEETSFFAKFFSLFKSNRDVPRKKPEKTKKNKCDQGCTELKKTAKTNSSVRRKSKTKRRSYKSHLTGKIKEPKLTEKTFSPSNKSNIQVNEMHVDCKNQVSQKSGPRRVNKMSNTETVANQEKSRRNVEKYKIDENSNTKEPTKGNLKKSDDEETKPNATQTENPQNSKAVTNEENSLRLCFSCLFPSDNCLCKRKFSEQRSCDCKKIVTFCCDELCKPSNDKKLHGSEVLPYQRLTNFPKVVNEMQGKMYENVKKDERCTCTSEECCDDKKPRAKCYYCKNLPCRCCVIGASRCTAKQ